MNGGTFSSLVHDEAVRRLARREAQLKTRAGRLQYIRRRHKQLHGGDAEEWAAQQMALLVNRGRDDLL